ncbi:MAG: hypothetical protein KDB88_12330 [Flavobacteriales bacterium]|nr:hypothetical protein [Flavobacteriales bacterium]
MQRDESGVACVTIMDATGTMATGCKIMRSRNERITIDCPQNCPTEDDSGPDDSREKIVRKTNNPFPKPREMYTNDRPAADRMRLPKEPPTGGRSMTCLSSPAVRPTPMGRQ